MQPSPAATAWHSQQTETNKECILINSISCETSNYFLHTGPQTNMRAIPTLRRMVGYTHTYSFSRRSLRRTPCDPLRCSMQFLWNEGESVAQSQRRIIDRFVAICIAVCELSTARFLSSTCEIFVTMESHGGCNTERRMVRAPAVGVTRTGR